MINEFRYLVGVGNITVDDRPRIKRRLRYSNIFKGNLTNIFMGEHIHRT